MIGARHYVEYSAKSDEDVCEVFEYATRVTLLSRYAQPRVLFLAPGDLVFEYRNSYSGRKKPVGGNCVVCSSHQRSYIQYHHHPPHAPLI
jgi:hypothetical protein